MDEIVELKKEFNIKSVVMTHLEEDFGKTIMTILGYKNNMMVLNLHMMSYRLVEINADGTAVMLVTHDANVAARTERIMFMRDGKIVSE